jgi:hypothetical protein
MLSSNTSFALIPHLISIASHEKSRLRAAAFRAMAIHIPIIRELCTRGIVEEPFRSVLRGSVLLRLYIISRLISLSRVSSLFPVACQALCSQSSIPELKTAALGTLRAIQSHMEDGSFSICNWSDSVLERDELLRLL